MTGKKNQETAESLEREYIAFISYRHRPLDKQAAERIQRAVERYTVPKELRELAGGKKLGKVFRDEDELPASSSLSGSITYALDHSKYLIVVCTPDLPKSAWCEQEIRYFTEKYGHDRVIAVLADGEPSESFSPLMLHAYDGEGNATADLEPLAANIAGKDHTIDRKAFRKEIVRVYAALIGCPFDALWQRERRRRTNTLLALAGVSAALLAGFSAVVLSKNAEIARQNKSLQRQLSTLKVDAGYTSLGEYDIQEALRNGLDAILPETEGEDLSDPRIRSLLADALGAYGYNDARSELVYRQSVPITKMLAVREESLLIVDEAGVIRRLSMPAMDPVWERQLTFTVSNDHDCELLLSEKNGIVLCKCSDRVFALSLTDGSELWRYEYIGNSHDLDFTVGTGLRALSPDESVLVLLDGDRGREDCSFLIVLNVSDGSERARVDLAEEGRKIKTERKEPWSYNTANFSEDGKRLALAVFSKYDQEEGGEKREDDLRCDYYLIDTGSWKELKHVHRDGYRSYGYTINFGCTVAPETYDLFCAQYKSEFGAIVISAIHWKENQFLTESTAQTIPSKSSIFNDSAYFQNAVPAKASGERAAVTAGNTLLLYDRNTGQKLKSWEFTDRILDLWWEDDEGKTLTVLCANGSMLRHEFPGKGTWTAFIGEPVDLAQAAGSGIFESDPGSMVISVPRERPGDIILTRKHTNDGLNEVPNDMENVYITSVLISPTGDRVYVFLRTDTYEYTVSVLDAGTFEELERIPLSDIKDTPSVMLDDTHFASGNAIYGLDGTKEEMPPPANQDPLYFSSGFYENRILSSGNLLTVSDIPAGDSGMNFCWLDGKPILLADKATFDSSSIPQSGGNGLVVALPSETKNSYTVLDALSGERSNVEDPYPGADIRILAIATEMSAFAVSDGEHVCLIHTDTGEKEELAFAYNAAEIQSMSFPNGDAYLAVLTVAGRIDIWDLSDGTRVFTCDCDNYASYQIFCSINENSGEMHLSVRYSDYIYGIWIDIDMQTWKEIVREANGMVYVEKSESVMLHVADSKILYAVQKIYTLDDLKLLAEKELEKYKSTEKE